MKHALIFTLAAAAATANPLTYPQGHKWNFSIGVENGVETGTTHSSADASGELITLPLSTAYKISSSQTAGYGRWFYLQSRLSYSIAFAKLYQAQARCSKNNFFDGDWSVILPFRVSSHQRITLGPQLGLAVMRHKIRAFVANGNAHDPYDVKYTAPLVGAVLGIEPTEALSLRFGLNLQFPNAKHRVDFEEWHSLGTSRHAIDAYVNIMYQVSKYLEIAGTLEHKAYSVYAQEDTDFNYGSAGYFRSSGTLGVKWVF